MSYGYSLKLIELNKASDKELLGVYLGAVCIKNDVSVAEVAQKLKVSRRPPSPLFFNVDFEVGLFANGSF